MRHGSSFALGYLVVWLVHAFVDLIRGAFELIAWLLGSLFGIAVLGMDYRRNDAFRRDLETAVAPYLPVLADKRAKLLRVDDYGVLRPEKWAKELKYFIDEVLIPNSGLDHAYIARNLRAVANHLDDLIAAHQPMSRKSPARMGAVGHHA